jgi:hypothetical protein
MTFTAQPANRKAMFPGVSKVVMRLWFALCGTSFAGVRSNNPASSDSIGQSTADDVSEPPVRICPIASHCQPGNEFPARSRFEFATCLPRFFGFQIGFETLLGYKSFRHTASLVGYVLRLGTRLLSLSRAICVFAAYHKCLGK